MVEAVMLWNEPNNLSHWDFKVDPDWKIFSRMTIAAARKSRATVLLSVRGRGARDSQD